MSVATRCVSIRTKYPASLYYISVCVSDNISFKTSNNLRFGVVCYVTDSHLGPFMRVYFILTHIMLYTVETQLQFLCVCAHVYSAVFQFRVRGSCSLALHILSWVRFLIIGVGWVVRGDAAAPSTTCAKYVCYTTVLLLFVYIWLQRRWLKRRNDNEIQADEINEGILFICRAQQHSVYIFVCRFAMLKWFQKWCWSVFNLAILTLKGGWSNSTHLSYAI